jgi:hypothetical protein
VRGIDINAAAAGLMGFAAGAAGPPVFQGGGAGQGPPGAPPPGLLGAPPGAMGALSAAAGQVRVARDTSDVERGLPGPLRPPREIASV